MVPVPALAFMHFGPVPIWVRYITGTGIKWCPYRYWHFFHVWPVPVWVQYITGTGINGASTGNVKENYAKCHNIYASTSTVPPLSGAVLELVTCVNWYPVAVLVMNPKKCQYAY
jgi:hypothetical protein